MKHTRILLLIALFAAAAVGSSRLDTGTITVMNTSDNGTGSLRQALADAVDGDTVNFDSSLNGQTITLTSGELPVDKSVAISGPGANMLAVDANHASRVFYIASGKNVTISGLSIINGSAPPPNYVGGGICNDHATLALNNCTISDNSAFQGNGGGIYNDAGTLILSSCTINGNSADRGDGGGIFNSVGTLTVSSTTLSGNSAWPGGGIVNYFGTATITNSTLSGNFTLGSNPGGGIFSNGGKLTITGSTISGNSATDVGGGMYTGGGTVTITNSTFSGNSTTPNHGGGIYNEGSTLKIGNTIFNAGSSGENIYNVDQLGPVTSLGYNLSSDDSGGYLTATGDRINTDPKLGPLQDNGGSTFTHLPASDSPAIDVGDPVLGMDQRGPGFQRVANGRIDVGAVEVQAIVKPPPSVQVIVQTNPAGLAFSVDGSSYTSTQTFSWTSGSTHAIATTSPQNGAPGVRYVWMNWAGGGAISHTVAPATNKTYTANFRTQYQLTMGHGTGGRVSPSSGWKNSGAIISTSATPNNGYSFTNWSGSGNGSYFGTSNPASITMNAPITETATFTHN